MAYLNLSQGGAPFGSRQSNLSAMLRRFNSFAVILALYEFLVRRVNVLRLLCAMKVKPKPKEALSLDLKGQVV